MKKPLIWIWLLPAFLALTGSIIGFFRLDGWLILKSASVFAGSLVLGELAAWTNLYW